MRDTFRRELQQFDKERVLPAWDGLVSRQQSTLEALGVPTMFPTSATAERQVRGTPRFARCLCSNTRDAEAAKGCTGAKWCRRMTGPHGATLPTSPTRFRGLPQAVYGFHDFLGVLTVATLQPARCRPHHVARPRDASPINVGRG